MIQTFLSDEIWKDIPCYEGIYQASTHGRIRTVDGKTTFTKKHGIRHWKSRILKGRGNNHVTGARVSLWKDGKAKDFLVARLIALTFLGQPPEKYTVNHKDGNRLNNHLDNLEWLSLEDNIRHGFETKLYSSQKLVVIKIAEKVVEFRSMAQCDVFLNRYKGYTSCRLKKHNSLVDSNGNIFQVLPF